MNREGVTQLARSIEGASKIQEIVIRPPELTDGPAITAMARESATLDVNSDYAYLLMCTHFATTCAIAHKGDESAAFVTGYIPPNKPETLFIWQICVRPAYRRLGLGLLLIESLLQRTDCKNVRYVAASINPSNHASQKMFHSLAKHHHTECQMRPFFSKDLFGSSNHEEELLYRVGPLKCNKQKE